MSEQQGVQTRSVEEKDNGIRLDKWFLHYFPNIKFGHLQKLMRSGQIRVNSKRVKGSTRIETGQKIRIPPLDAEAANPVKQDVKVRHYRLTDEDRVLLQEIVIYEDDNIIAVNKPVGLPVQGGTNQKRHLDGILGSYAAEQKIDRPHLVHRLDKETSGVFIVAKNVHAARKLGHMFQQRQIQKYYWAACFRTPEHNDGEITAPLAKHKARHGEYMTIDPENGKSAHTSYHVVQRLSKRTCWIIFSPLTGRTHQIRAHASLMGCPIIGDRKYATPEEQEGFQDMTQDPDPKLHLHAQQLIIPNIFENKHSKEVIDITAPLPEHMQATWDRLGFSETHINNTDFFEEND